MNRIVCLTSSTPTFQSTAMVILALVFTIGSVQSVYGETGVALEQAVDADGTRSYRHITVADEFPAESVPADGTAAPFPSREINVYDWLDTSHFEAIPADVAISGDGSYGVAGWWLNNERTALYEIDGDNVPEWTRSMTIVEFEVSVDIDDTGERLSSTGRFDSLYVFDAASEIPVYSHAHIPPRVHYFSEVSDLGNFYASGAADPSGSGGDVRVYDASGTKVLYGQFPSTPQGISLSDDGALIAGNTRAQAKVWDISTGTLRDSLTILGETQVGAVLSGDGSTLVYGGFWHIMNVYEWDGNEYTFAWARSIPSTTWITALAISEDGSTVAAGTWTNPTGGKVVLWDTSSSDALWTDDTYGDYVSSLSFSSDGQFLAAGSWGRLDGTVGNIISVYSRESRIPIHAITDDAFAGVGSCFSVSLSEDGSKLLAGGKAGHARAMGSGGWVMALDLPVSSDLTEDETMLVPTLARLVAEPNPFRADTHVSWSRSLSTPGVLRVLDASGRLVRTEDVGREDQAWTWDGRDDAGRTLPSGVYFVRLGLGSTNGSDRTLSEALRVLRIR